MTKKQKLELTWIGKENRPRLEPRILLEDPGKSYHAQYRVKDWPQENAKNTEDSDFLRSFAATSSDQVGDIFNTHAASATAACLAAKRMAADVIHCA